MAERHKNNERIELFSKAALDVHPIFQPEEDYERLFQAIREDKLVVFFGAGVSRLAGCLSWAELACKIVNTFPNDVFTQQEKEILRNLAWKDPRRVISICYTRTQLRDDLKDIYYSAIKKSVTPPDNRQPEFSNIHTKLARLKALSYVTTNIDRGMESAKPIGDERVLPFNLTTLDKFDARDLRNGNIFYLHGSTDDLEKTIFTANHYHKFYNSMNTPVKHFLENLFSGDLTVLFIGYGLEEQEILHSIFTSNVSETPGLKEPRHFLLAPVYSSQLAEFNLKNMFLDIYSVKAIPYFIDYEGYERLFNVLDALQKLIEDKKIPPIQIRDLMSGDL